MEVINIYVMTWSTVLFSRFLDITDGEQSVHTVIVISVPVTVAIIGIIAVAIFRIYRKTRPKRDQTDREHNKPKETVEGERGVAVAEDNESVHIYTECDAVYHSNKDYLTPSMTTSQSFDNTDYLLPTPKSTKSKWQPGSVGSLPRASGKDCSGVPDKEERRCNQYESVLPKCGNSENHYEILQKELNTKAHKSSAELYDRRCNQYESVLPKCGNSENHYEKLQKELNTNAHKSSELYDYV